jgi:hypothetical protein
VPWENLCPGEGEALLSADCEPSPAEIPEGARHCDLDIILTDWHILAAHAYRGFLHEGPGILVIILGKNENATLSYVTAQDVCPCCSDLLREYEPERQAVIAVQRGGNQSLYVLAGYPSPPQAFKTAPAKMFEQFLN